MNTRSSLLLALALLPLTPAVAQINVTGSAEVKVAPDEIYISAGVETRDKVLEEAKRQNDQRMVNVLAFLKASGVAEKDVQTDFIGIDPSYESDYSRTKPVVYIVRKSLQIKLTTITNYEAILTGLLNNGVNTLHGVDFRTSKLRAYRDQARNLAVKAAQEKADALAEASGVKRGKVSSITANEWGGSWYGNYWGARGGGQFQNAAQNMGSSADGAGETLSLGQISVSATVNVTFVIE
jgi:uncharacterized protein YggE